MAFPLPDLPLVGKELTEQAAQHRTYLMRMVYAVLFYGAFLLIFREDLTTDDLEQFASLGKGRQLFDQVMFWLFAATYVLLPASVCNSVVSERMNGTLPLLFLTGMGPGRLALQKLIGRLVPVFTWVLLSFPLMGVAYSMGGVDESVLIAGGWSLLVNALLVGSFALWMAASAEDPTRALVAVYLRGLVVFTFVFGGVSMLLGLGSAVLYFVLEVEQLGMLAAGLYPAVAYFLIVESSSHGAWILVALLPSTVATVVFMLRAREALQQSVLIQRKVDPDAALRALVRGENSAGDIGDKPIAWLERGRLLSTFGSINTSLVSALFVILLILTVMVPGTWRDESMVCTVTVSITWACLATGIIMCTVGALSGERQAGTLQVLLTTPMPGEQILSEKLYAAKRLLLWSAIPFGITAIVATLREGPERFAWYLGGSAVTIIIYGMLLTWLTAWLALRINRMGRAVMIALVGVSVWCFGPMWAFAVLEQFGFSVWPPLQLLSPIGMLAMLELPGRMHDEVVAGEIWVLLLINTIVYGGLLVFVRHYCRSHAGVLLGRSGQ